MLKCGKKLRFRIWTDFLFDYLTDNFSNWGELNYSRERQIDRMLIIFAGFFSLLALLVHVQFRYFLDVGSLLPM